MWTRDILRTTYCTSNKPFSLVSILKTATLNTISEIAFSKRMASNVENPENKELLDSIQRAISKLGFPSILDMFIPQLRVLVRWGNLEMKRNVAVIQRTLLKVIKEHSDTLDASNPRDIVDDLLIDNIDAKTIVHIVVDIALAGSDTTSITLYWFIAYMINYPDVAARLRVELDKKIGQNSEITIEKCETCPYLIACINETLRLKGPLPMSVPHLTLQPTALGPYHLPANTMVIPLTRNVHLDPLIWGPDADEFRPERYLAEERASEQGKEAMLMPFGVGLRRCVGEELAKVELILFAANLMVNFLWSAPEGGEGKVKMDETFGLTLNPVFTNVIVSVR